MRSLSPLRLARLLRHAASFACHQRGAHPRLWPLVMTLPLLLAACGGQAAQATASPTATPLPLGGKFATATAQSWTPTPPADAALHAPIPGAQLQWRSVSLPSGFGFAYHQSWFAVASGDGARAYSCAQAGPSQPVQTIATGDGGASWQSMGTFAQPWDGCMGLTVDSLNPNIAVMSGIGEPAAYTLDGAHSWRASSNAVMACVQQLATAGGRTYALSCAKQGLRLAVSSDGMSSWQDISGPMAGSDITALAVSPSGGALLAETSAGYDAAPTLWTSSDGGAHWASRSVPFTSSGTFVATPSATSGAWAVCLNEASGPAAGIACSSDSGAHWRTLPALYDTGLRGYDVFGLRRDGAVLAQGTNDAGWRIYRLAPGAARWQALGPAPATTGTLLYAPTPAGDGVVWSFPSVKGGGSGDANPSDIAVASYPY